MRNGIEFSKAELKAILAAIDDLQGDGAAWATAYYGERVAYNDLRKKICGYLADAITDEDIRADRQYFVDQWPEHLRDRVNDWKETGVVS